MDEAFVDGFGLIRRCMRVHQGAFDVYRGEHEGTAVALKVGGTGSASGTAFLATHSVVFSRLHSAFGRAGSMVASPAPTAQLELQAERVRSTHGADSGRREHSDRRHVNARIGRRERSGATRVGDGQWAVGTSEA